MILKWSSLFLKAMCLLQSMHTHAITKGSANNSHNTQHSGLEMPPLLPLPGGLLLAFTWLQDTSCCFSLPSIWVICYTSEKHTSEKEANHIIPCFPFWIVSFIFLLEIIMKSLQISYWKYRKSVSETVV